MRIEFPYFRMRGMLRPGYCGWLSWNRGGEPSGNIRIHVQESSIEWICEYSVAGDDEWRDVHEHVPFTFSGQRGYAEGALKSKLAASAMAISALFAVVDTPARAADCIGPAKPGVDWSDCARRNLVIKGSNLQDANLFGTDFTSTDLRGANLKSANLEKASLVGSSLAGANADKANFTKVEAYRCSFAGISAEDASFASAELQRANFSQARLTGANFEKAELGRANFDEAILTGTRFSFANLSRADLSGAIFDGPVDFSSAFMFLTRIEGLDLSAASGLQQDQIGLACGDSATKLPTGLSAPANWPCTLD